MRIAPKNEKSSHQNGHTWLSRYENRFPSQSSTSGLYHFFLVLVQIPRRSFLFSYPPPCHWCIDKGPHKAIQLLLLLCWTNILRGIQWPNRLQTVYSNFLKSTKSWKSFRGRLLWFSQLTNLIGFRMGGLNDHKTPFTVRQYNQRAHSLYLNRQHP